MSTMKTSFGMRPEKFFLKEAISLDALYELMEGSEIAFPGNFKLKKGAFGKSITFDVYMSIQPVIHVKDNIVKISTVEKSSSVSVGGMPGIDIKATKQIIQAAKEGGLGKAFTGGSDYYMGIIEAMRELLESRM